MRSRVESISKVQKKGHPTLSTRAAQSGLKITHTFKVVARGARKSRNGSCFWVGYTLCNLVEANDVACDLDNVHD